MVFPLYKLSKNVWPIISLALNLRLLENLMLSLTLTLVSTRPLLLPATLWSVATPSELSMLGHTEVGFRYTKWQRYRMSEYGLSGNQYLLLASNGAQLLKSVLQLNLQLMSES